MVSPLPFPGSDPSLIKRQTNLLTLVPGLRRIAGTQGGEYAGPCPFCGGTDRFHAQPHRSEGGLWMCRECTEGQWGDVIAFVMRRDSVGFKDALQRLGGPLASARAHAPALKPAPRVERGPVVATYEYTDETGAPLFAVWRHDPKTFTQHAADGHGGWLPTLNGTRRVLYQLPTLVKAPPDQPIWLVEGEKDADRLIKEGLPATTNPGGTGMGWRAEYTEALRGRRVVYVPDTDEAGQEFARKVQAALVSVVAHLKVVDLGAKDVSDWLDAGHTVDELMALAKDTPSEVAPTPAPGPYRLLTREQVAGLPPPEWLVTDLLEVNTVAMLYGQTGIGKTFVTLDLALAVATGQPWWGQPVKAGPVLYILGEGMSGLNARLSAWERVRNVPAHNIHFVVDSVNLMGHTVAVDLARALPTPPALIIFDTLARCIGTGDENDNTDMNQMVNTINALREATGAAVLLIHHPGKTDTGPRGASCIPNACDTILKLTGSSDLLKLQGEKQRNGPTDNPWHFALEVIEVGTRADSGQPLTSCVITLASNARPAPNVLTPNQRTMLTVLNGRTLDPASAQELMDATNLSKSVIYRELETLAERDLIAQDLLGRARRYTITPAGRELLEQLVHSRVSLGIPNTNAELVPVSLPVPLPYKVGLGGKLGPDVPCTDCGAVAWFMTPAGTWRCGTCGQLAEEVAEL